MGSDNVSDLSLTKSPPSWRYSVVDHSFSGVLVYQCGAASYGLYYTEYKQSALSVHRRSLRTILFTG